MRVAICMNLSSRGRVIACREDTHADQICVIVFNANPPISLPHCFQRTLGERAESREESAASPARFFEAGPLATDSSCATMVFTLKPYVSPMLPTLRKA